MTRMHTFLVMAVFAGLVFAPHPARADGFVVPWVAGNTGTRNAGSLIDVGASVGATAAGVVDIDVDLGYSPDFFGSGVNSYVLTTMANVTVGIPFGSARAPRIRPYLTGGIGLIRTHIDDPFSGYSLARNAVGADFGGGVMGFIADHIGVRADLRVIRSLQDNPSSNPFRQFDLGGFQYWRTSLGLVIR